MPRRPLLSIVIPTYGRPQLLPRAINSALRSASDNDVEVIVIPNGPDKSWKQVASCYASESRVTWNPINIQNANAARNHGVGQSAGKYVRFLDDDDVLVAAGAQKQLRIIESSGAEICSGTVNRIDQKGRLLNHIGHPDSTDFLIAMTLEGRICLPLSHLFLRSALDSFSWNEMLRVEQDTEWMLRLASRREWNWLPIEDVVGEWVWHDGQRTSASITHPNRQKMTALLLTQSMAEVCNRDALSPSRRAAFARTLWALAHSSFKHAPLFWSKIAKFALKDLPGRRPPDPFFRRSFVRSIDPIIIEWLMIPKRWMNEWMRKSRDLT